MPLEMRGAFEEKSADLLETIFARSTKFAKELQEKCHIAMMTFSIIRHELMYYAYKASIAWWWLMR